MTVPPTPRRAVAALQTALLALQVQSAPARALTAPPRSPTAHPRALTTMLKTGVATQKARAPPPLALAASHLTVVAPPMAVAALQIRRSCRKQTWCPPPRRCPTGSGTTRTQVSGTFYNTTLLFKQILSICLQYFGFRIQFFQKM